MAGREQKNIPSVFEYLEPNAFLRDLLLALKATNARFSLRAWAKKLGVTNSGTLSRVVNGSRPMTEALVQKLVDLYSLSPQEGAYLNFLAHSAKLSPVVTMQVRAVFRSRENAKRQDLKGGDLAGIVHWLFPALYNLGALEGKPTGLEEILALFPSSEHAELRRVLQQMRTKGFITEKNGQLSFRREKLFFASEESPANVRDFHRVMLAKALEALQIFPVEQRVFGSSSIAISAKNLPRLFRLTEDFHRDVMALTEDEGADHVYQVSTQCFPLLLNKEAK